MEPYIKIKKVHFLLLLYIFCPFTIKAQQDPEYTQYMYNTMSVNSAYAGSTGTLEASLLHRSQWVGIDGAPQTQAFAIHSPMRNDKVGLGFSLVNDKLGPSNELYIDGNFSYSIAFANERKLAFGLKAGMRILNVDWSRGRYNDPIDVLLNENIDNKMKPSIGAGLYYYSDKWYIGASVPSFIRGDYYDDVEEAIDYDRFHYYFIGGYVFNFSDNLKFKPAFMLKAVSGAPMSADISANFLIQEKFTLGASHRLGDSVSALAGFQVTNSIYLGYAFDYTVTDLNKYNDGSHEFILRYQFQKKSQQIKSPRFF